MSIEKYRDIIYRKHPESEVHRRMSRENRAAQFAPFAALTGYEEEIAETSRLTESRPEMTEEEKEILNRKFMEVSENVNNGKVFVFTCFIPDKRKAGGSYTEYEGSVRKIFHETENYETIKIMLDNNVEISVKDIISIHDKQK